MIPRYSRPEMADVWSEENKLNKWLEVEILACEGLAESGAIPKDAARIIRQKAGFNIERVREIEKITKHDVAAFVSNVAEYVGPEGRFIHLGLTSSDVLDTGLSVQLKEASALILKEIDLFLAVLKERAYEFKHTATIGRSHGIHAEPTTFGLKLALWHEEMKRNRERMARAAEVVSYGKISGAVGTFANIDPFVEKYVCERLGLKPAPVSTQVLQRDRHAEYLSTLALIGCSVEKIALEIRHLQRTELGEAEECFTKGQKGSSAMPHKRNPVVSEQLCGLVRILRGNAMAAMENVALWHERDISHSSVERVIFPDSAILLHYMLCKIRDIISNLVVYPEKMLENLNETKGLIFSQLVLLELARAGVARDEAYRMVQRNAMRVYEKGEDFLNLLLEDPEIGAHLKPDAIKSCFDIRYHTKHVDAIFERVFQTRKKNHRTHAASQ